VTDTEEPAMTRLDDRAEITELMHRYAWAIDELDLDVFADVFTADAHLDYSSNPGGVSGGLAEVAEWLRASLAYFVVRQHSMANTLIHFVDDDHARAKTMVHNPMGARTRAGRPHMFTIGARYDDELIRTPAGWRISQRVETLLFLDGTLPSELVGP
jgi:3-phenylpropionate/cinnamic acid dioxygenase small subunit